MNFVIVFGNDSVKGDKFTLISNHRSMISVSSCLFSNREKHLFHSTACTFHACCRSCCASTLWVHPSVQIFDVSGNTRCITRPSVVLRAEYAC